MNAVIMDFYKSKTFCLLKRKQAKQIERFYIRLFTSVDGRLTLKFRRDNKPNNYTS